MSQNVDLVRTIYANWERGDFSSAEWAHPDVEFVIPDGPSPGSWSGLAGMAKGYGGYIDVYENVRINVEQVRELDDGTIVALFRRIGRAKTSGIVELPGREMEGAVIFHLRGGRVSRLVLYFERERALLDLGLTAEDT
jgi:ketosteroid isomerase-like protein